MTLLLTESRSIAAKSQPLLAKLKNFMKHKLLLYSLLPLAGLTFLGANIASAHGWFGGFGGLGSTATPDEVASQQQTMFQNEAQILGISVDDVKNAWAEGKSISQLIKDKGLNQADIQARMKDFRIQQLKTQLAALVDKGVITQDQADKRLAFMQNNLQNKKGGIWGMGFKGFRL